MGEDEAVQTFISANEADFTARRNRKEGSQGFLNTLKQKAASLTAGGSKVEGDPEPWFSEKADDILKREVALTQMVQGVQKMINQYQTMIKKYTAHIASLREFMQILSPGALNTAMSNEVNALEQAKEYLEDMVCQLTVTVNGNLLDYIHELQAINAVLERRAPLVRTFLSTKSSSESSPSPEVQAKYSEAQLALDTFSNAARADIQQICELRNADMQRFFEVFGKFYSEFYDLLGKEWNKALGKSASSGPVVTAAAISESDSAF